MFAGLYTGFLPRGGELGVCREAVRSCMAAAGGWGIQGGARIAQGGANAPLPP